MLFISAITILALCSVAAVFDFTQMRLPNAIIIAILAVFIPVLFLSNAPELSTLKQHLLAFGITFIITGILFVLNVFGAGDAKLISALALCLGTKGLAVFFFVMSLAGFVLGVTALLFKKNNKKYNLYNKIPKIFKPEKGWVTRLHNNENAIPYGIAIMAGLWAAFINIGYLDIPNQFRI